MKKLLTAAVASTFAFLAMGVVNGDEINQGADFEASGFVSGEAFNAALDDEAGAYGDKFWYTEDTEADNVISNYPSTGTAVPIASRPDKFASNSNSKYLRVETTGKLWRSVKNNGGSSDFLTNTVQSLETYGYSITNSAIYLDTLVKFTPADGEFAADALSDGDKIAISYVEHEADTDGDVSYTNFVIRAGLIRGSELFQTNYFAYLPDDPTFANFDKDAWHRLTVRTIPEVGTSENPGGVGFVVYVDETPLAYSADVDAGFGTLNATAQGFYDNAKHALFPSARKANAIGGQTISAASFSGNGSIDDVVFTTTTPGFIEATESIAATITLGTGISGVTVSVSGTPVEPADSTANPLVFNLAPGTTTFTLAVTADSANGYSFDAATGITAENASYDNGTVTISGGAPTLTLKATRNNFNLFAANGDPIAGTYQTLGEALAATGVAKIQLAYNYDVTDADIPDGYIELLQSITLDLNGQTLDGGVSVSDPLFMVTDGNFVIIDSVGGGKVVYDGPGIVYGATAYIGATSGDMGPTFDGQLFYEGGEGNVVRGKFDETSNTTSSGEPAFLWEAYLGDGDSVESECTGLVSGYWVVAPKGSGDEDWKDPSEITKDATAGDTYGITGDLAAADAVELTEWATGVGSVTFANKDTINIDCFLLNIANNSTAQEIQDEKDEFVVNISFDPVTGEPVVTTPDGKTYNGKFKVYGSDDLTTPKASWHEQTDGDTFFYGKLVP